MNIQEAVKALRENKTINCANSRETMTREESDMGDKVLCALHDSKEKQRIYLTRFEILYAQCTFALGPYKDLGKDGTSDVESKKVS